MNTGEEKFAQTEPLNEDRDNSYSNDVDNLGKEAGLEMPDHTELGLKDKLEQRDDSRLDLDSAPQTLAE
ncbi:MAG: DUF6335 family protein [Pleurocapsa sp.]